MFFLMNLFSFVYVDERSVLLWFRQHLYFHFRDDGWLVVWATKLVENLFSFSFCLLCFFLLLNSQEKTSVNGKASINVKVTKWFSTVNIVISLINVTIFDRNGHFKRNYPILQLTGFDCNYYHYYYCFSFLCSEKKMFLSRDSIRSDRISDWSWREETSFLLETEFQW